MKRSVPVIKALTGLLLLIWPFIIWFGLTYHTLYSLIPVMILLLLLRFYQSRREQGPLSAVTQIVSVAGVSLCVASYLLNTHQLMLFYPVVVNGVMLVMFAGSLWSTMPLIERLARLRRPDLSARGVRYTRRVTQCWSLFFILNGSMALFTALYGDISLWTTWNGLLSYLLMGTLMIGEWLVRQRMLKQEKQ